MADKQRILVPPKLTNDFNAWLHEIEVWKLVTSLEKKKLGLSGAAFYRINRSGVYSSRGLVSNSSIFQDLLTGFGRLAPVV